MGGENFNMESDEAILQITSPIPRLNGPYLVVYKDVTERWAIVAMEWDNGHRVLGMRWFKGAKGCPVSSSRPIWLVLPEKLHKSIVDGLPISYKKRLNIERFLAREITGEELYNVIYQTD